MDRWKGIAVITGIVVITALMTGCVSQADSRDQNEKFNKTAERSLSPQEDNRPPAPDQSRSPAKGDKKSAGTAISGNLSPESLSCLNHTRNNAACKDCCDCLPGDADARKSCRDACATHDFSMNTEFINVTAVSVRGPQGDYSTCSSAGSATACKECCDGSAALACGDRRFCRDVCNALDGATPPLGGGPRDAAAR